MGPDNFVRPPNDRPRPRPNYPSQPRPQRPMQDFVPRSTQPMQPLRPASPRPAQHTQNLQPQAAAPQPQLSPRPLNAPYQPAPGPTATAPSVSQTVNTDFSPQNSPHQRTKKKLELPKPSKLSLVLGSIAIVILAGLVVSSVWQNKPDSTAKAQNKAPSVKPLEQPSFTTYYPSAMPDGLSLAKGSISYYKNSFTFILEQGGQKSFFVYEQPANTDPDFTGLKSKLAAPQSISLSVGQGIEGGLDNGTVTAIKTDKNTIIMVNCTKVVCSTAPRDILSSMQVNSDLASLKNSN